MLQRFFTLVFLLLFVNPVFTQVNVVGFKRYGRSEGVPTTSNNKIFESSDHFLWLSTESGLYKFDGYQFSPFFANIKDSTTLSSNIISDIEEDRSGNLWVSTFGKGVNKLNRITGKWKQYLHPTKDNVSFYLAYDLFKDFQGRLWLGTSGRGLLLYNDKTDSFQQFIPDTSKNKKGEVPFENEVRSIAADVQDPAILWLAGTDGLYRFNTKLQTFKCFKNFKKGEADWINNSFHVIYIQDTVNIWLGAWGGGLIHFNITTNIFTNYPPYPKEYIKRNFSRNIISCIESCTDSSLYISSLEGLFEFNLLNKTFKLISEELTHEGKNAGMVFHGITHTSDGSTWICSSDNIFQKHPVYDRLAKYQSFYQPKEKFVYKPTLTGVLYLKDSKQYWMSCSAGFGVYVYDSNFRYLRSISVKGLSKDLNFEEIKADAAGIIWLLSSDPPFLYYYDKEIDQFKEAASRFADPCFISAGLLTMETDRKGNMWWASQQQLFKWNPIEKHLQTFSPNDYQKNGRTELWGRVQIAFNAYNDPWLATNIGLYYYNQRKRIWEKMDSVQRKKPSLANKFLESIAIDKNGNCWLAPQDEGLQVYDPSSQKFIKHYIQAEGFFSTRVHEVVTDSKGDLWIAGNNGLARYEIEQDHWFTFNQEDGLPSDNLYLPIFALANGTMVLAMQHGFIYWNIHSLPENSKKPIVYFNRLISGGIERKIENNRIRLPYSGNELSIEFSAIATIMSSRTKFYYKMLPLQKEWLATTQRSISLAGFVSGKYQLLIKAVNTDGIESDIKQLDIWVAYPFWKTGWFILLTVLTIATILYLLYRFRIQQLLRVQNLRNDISRDLHDEIGSSVSSVNMLAMVAKKQLGEQHPVTPLLSQIGESAQNAGDSIDEIIWSIHPQNDSIERIILRMKELAAEMLEPYEITYQINFDNQLTQLDISMQNRRHLFMLFKESLNNMIKYAGCKKAFLVMQVMDKNLVLKIEDDGIGFDTASYKPGNGLLNMQQRATEMKAELMITTSPGKGCSIELRYPLK